MHHDDTGNMGTERTEQSPNANRKAGKLNTYYFFNRIYGIDINPINILFGEFAFAEFISFPPIDYCLCKFWLNG